MLVIKGLIPMHCTYVFKNFLRVCSFYILFSYQHQHANVLGTWNFFFRLKAVYYNFEKFAADRKKSVHTKF